MPTPARVATATEPRARGSADRAAGWGTTCTRTGRRDPRDVSVRGVAEGTFQSTPCNRWFGFVLRHWSADRVELELPVRAEFLQEEGVVQGGVLTALADTAAVWLLWPDLGPHRAMTGVECKMNFLGAATAPGLALVAVATML